MLEGFIKTASMVSGPVEGWIFGPLSADVHRIYVFHSRVKESERAVAFFGPRRLAALLLSRRPVHAVCEI